MDYPPLTETCGVIQPSKATLPNLRFPRSSPPRQMVGFSETSSGLGLRSRHESRLGAAPAHGQCTDKELIQLLKMSSH